ncbi:hypothetical protein BDR26DRAFT_901582 [Obelidium mucronatum]|nr:hypothetical protein BDR26DRAFT_901582 [Obelidium mucronatum]
MEPLFAQIRQVNEMLKTVESTASSCASQGDDTAHKLRVLTEDFVYNLGLLEERDRELDKCEELVRILKAGQSERDAQLSELKMVLADKTSDLDNLKSFHQNQDIHHAEMIRKIRRDHEEYIQAIHQKEKSMNELQITCDLKLKGYIDELESLRNVDKKLKEAQWELLDHGKQSASEIANLKHELQKTLQSQIQLLKQEIEALLEKNLGLEYHMKAQAESQKSAVKTLESALQSRDSEITALNDQVEKLTKKLAQVVDTHDSKYDVLGSDLSSKENQVQQLEDQIRSLKSDLSSSRDEIRKHKAVELELQTNLNELVAEKSVTEKWAEETILRKLKESEKYIKSVLQEKEILAQDFDQLKAEFKAVLKSRSQLEKELQDWQTADSNEDGRNERISELEQQNAQLQAIIKQMRNDMEAVQNELAHSPPTQPPEFSNFIAHDAAIANQQLQQLAEIIQQKQQLIDQLLRNSAQNTTPISQTDSGNSSATAQAAAEKLATITSENEALKQRIKDLTSKVVEASGDRMRLLDMSNALRAQVRMLMKAGGGGEGGGREAKTARSIETQSKPLTPSTACILSLIFLKLAIAAKLQSESLASKKEDVTAEVRKNSGQSTLSSKRSKSAPTSTEKIPAIPDRDPRIELERKRRMKGIRNWNEVDDL